MTKKRKYQKKNIHIFRFFDFYKSIRICKIRNICRNAIRIAINQNFTKIRYIKFDKQSDNYRFFIFIIYKTIYITISINKLITFFINK